MLRADAQRLVAGGAMELVTAVEVAAVRVSAPGLTVVTTRGPLGPFDEIVAATGFRPNLAMLGELRVELDPALESPRALAPLIDPHIHSCATVPHLARRCWSRARAGAYPLRSSPSVPRPASGCG